MSYQVVTLRRADADVEAVVTWLGSRSPSGAYAWLDAYDKLIAKLPDLADLCGLALEDTGEGLRLKQAFFRTRRGRTYRAVFTIVGDEVRILRIRGPSQAGVDPAELL